MIHESVIYFWEQGPDKIVRIKTPIPFKHRDEIIRHICKAHNLFGSTYYYSDEDDKDKWESGNNCERFANRCVLGLDLSEHAEVKKEKNLQKKGTIYHKKEKFDKPELEKKIKETSNFLDGLTNDAWLIDGVKKHINTNFDKIGSSFDAVIKVEPKYGYKFK